MHKPFQELQKLWYSRLKEEGFEDCEDTNNPEYPLKAWHSFKWADTNQDKEYMNQEYYTRASALLETYCFDNTTHKAIWELHASGTSIRKIERLIALLQPVYKREQIRKIIKFIELSII